MGNRNQIELRYSIGWKPCSVPAINEFNFRDTVIKAASFVCGGCTVYDADGYWMEDGAESKTVFTGKLEEETALVLSVSCEERKYKDVLRDMKLAIIDAVSEHSMEVNWVHVQKFEFFGLHFNARPTFGESL